VAIAAISRTDLDTRSPLFAGQVFPAPSFRIAPKYNIASGLLEVFTSRRDRFQKETSKPHLFGWSGVA
jgi:hypothetical protein